jgi:hypothetical protein
VLHFVPQSGYRADFAGSGILNPFQPFLCAS